MLRVWVHGCDPGRVSDGSRPEPCQTLSIECALRLSFSGMCIILLLLFLSLCRFCLCFFLLLSSELGKCSSDPFLSSRPCTGLATTYISGYGRGPIGKCEENNNRSMADLLCHRTFFSYKNNTLNVLINKRCVQIFL